MIDEDINMEKKRRLRGFAGRLFLCVVIIISNVALGNQAASQSDQPTKYELKLEDGNIEIVILKSGDEKKTFEKPGKVLCLKPAHIKSFICN